MRSLAFAIWIFLKDSKRHTSSDRLKVIVDSRAMAEPKSACAIIVDTSVLSQLSAGSRNGQAQVVRAHT